MPTRVFGFSITMLAMHLFLVSCGELLPGSFLNSRSDAEDKPESANEQHSPDGIFNDDKDPGNIAKGDDYRVIQRSNVSDYVVLKDYRILVRHPRLGSDTSATLNVGPFAQGADSAEEFAKILDEVRNRTSQTGNGIRVVVVPGNYYFRSSKKGLLIDRIKDLEFGGDDSDSVPKFIFTQPTVEGILVTSSERILLRKLHLSYEYPSSYGKSYYFAKKVSDQDLKIEGLASGEADKIGAVYSYNQANGRFDSMGSSFFMSFEKVAKPIYNESTQSFRSTRFRKLPTNGSYLVLHSRSGYKNAVRALGLANQDIIFDSLTLEQYPQMGFTASGFSGFKLSNCNIKSSDSIGLTGRADGIHINGMSGNIVVEKNTVQGQGDDGLNLRGTDISLTNFDPVSGTFSYQANWDSYLEQGDLIEIQTNGNEKLAEGKLLSFDQSKITIDWRSCGTQCRRGVYDKLKAQASTTRFGIAYNRNHSSGRSLVQLNEFKLSGGRGILLQAPLSMVTKNKIIDVPGSAILATSENGNFLDGPGPENALISENTIESVNFRLAEADLNRNAAIAYAGSERSKVGTTVKLGVLKDNIIRGTGFSGLLISRANQVHLINNTISSVAQNYTNNLPPYLREASPVVDSENVRK